MSPNTTFLFPLEVFVYNLTCADFKLELISEDRESSVGKIVKSQNIGELTCRDRPNQENQILYGVDKEAQKRIYSNFEKGRYNTLNLRYTLSEASIARNADYMLQLGYMNRVPVRDIENGHVTTKEVYSEWIGLNTAD